MKTIILLTMLSFSTLFAETRSTHVIYLKNSDIYLVNLIASTPNSFVVKTSAGDTLDIAYTDVREIKRILPDASRPAMSEDLNQPFRSIPADSSPPVEQDKSSQLPAKIREFNSTYPVILYKFGIGVNVPSKPAELNRDWHNGFHINAGIGSKIGISSYACIDLDYVSFYHIKTGSVGYHTNSTGLNGGERDVNVFTVMVNLKTLVKSPMEKSIYFHVGAGYMRMTADSPESNEWSWAGTSTLTSESAFVFSPGVGIIFPNLHSRYNFFFETSLTVGFTAYGPTVYYPFKIGIMKR